MADLTKDQSKSYHTWNNIKKEIAGSGEEVKTGKEDLVSKNDIKKELCENKVKEAARKARDRCNEATDPEKCRKALLEKVLEYIR